MGRASYSHVMSRVRKQLPQYNTNIGFCARNRAVFNHQLEQYQASTKGGGPAKPFFSYHLDPETIAFTDDGALTADLKLKCCHRKNPTGYKTPVEDPPSTPEPDTSDTHDNETINTKYPDWKNTSSNTTNTLT